MSGPRISLALAAILLTVASPASADHAPTWVVPDDFRVASHGSPASGQPRAGVDRWVGVTLDLVRSHSTNPPRAARVLALVSVAMNDAVVTLEHSLRSAGRRDREAAAGAAAWRVLAGLYPDRAAVLAGLGHGATAGADAARAVGRRVARQVIARARTDGSDAVSSGTRPKGPGKWEPTPPALVESPLEPAAGAWRPWNLTHGAQLRPPPPPAFYSLRFEREMREVYDTAWVLTEDEKRIALFWADGPGTFTPAGHWTQIARRLVRRARLPAGRAAFVFATLATAQADAFIACWDAKYAYWSIRPVTAIRQRLDPSFLPFIATPPFPSYVSGHSTTSGAASTVLARFFPRSAGRLRAMADEAAVSRLYGGIHFVSDNEAGLALGRDVGREALRGPRR
jgi:hypothetical protein